MNERTTSQDGRSSPDRKLSFVKDVGDDRDNNHLPGPCLLILRTDFKVNLTANLPSVGVNQQRIWFRRHDGRIVAIPLAN